MLGRLIGVILLINLHHSAFGSISETYIKEAFIEAAVEFNVPEVLLSAICFAESNHNPYAYNHNDLGSLGSSYGLCQVSLLTAEDLGFVDQGEKCKRDFRTIKEYIRDEGPEKGKNFTPIPRIWKECALFGPKTSAKYAAKYIKWQFDRKLNKGSWRLVTASYNTGSPKICKTGKVYRRKDGKELYSCEIGKLLNQRYVDRVWKSLGGQ